MTSDEWLDRMRACRSELGKRVLLALMAADQTVKMEPEARKIAMVTALGCTDSEFEAAIRELERAGLAKIGWVS